MAVGLKAAKILIRYVGVVLLAILAGFNFRTLAAENVGDLFVSFEKFDPVGKWEIVDRPDTSFLAQLQTKRYVIVISAVGNDYQIAIPDKHIRFTPTRFTNSEMSAKFALAEGGDTSINLQFDTSNFGLTGELNISDDLNTRKLTGRLSGPDMSRKLDRQRRGAKEAVAKRLDELVRHVESLEATIEERKGEIVELQGEARELAEQVSMKNKEIRKGESDREALQGRLFTSRKKRELLEKDIEKEKRATAISDSEKRRVSKKIQSLQSKVSQLQKRTEKFQKQEALLFEAQASVDAETDEITRLRQKVVEFKSQAKSLEQAVADRDAAIATAAKRMLEAENQAAEYKEKAAGVDQLRKRMSEAEKQAAEYKDKAAGVGECKKESIAGSGPSIEVQSTTANETDSDPAAGMGSGSQVDNCPREIALVQIQLNEYRQKASRDLGACSQDRKKLNSRLDSLFASLDSSQEEYRRLSAECAKNP